MAQQGGEGLQGFGQYPPPFAQYGAPQHYGQQNAYTEQLRGFWQEQYREIEQVPADAQEFKNHQLPLARIKKIMKSDEDVRMISAEAPVLFAKACEMFILELTLRAWYHAEENKRRTLQRNDIAAAITRTDIFDFLVDIVPREDGKADEEGAGPSGTGAGGAAAAGQQQQQQPTMAPMPPGMYPYPGAFPGAPGMPMDPSQMMGYPGFPMGMPGQPWPGQQQQQQQPKQGQGDNAS